MAERLRDKSGRVFLVCEQLLARKGYTRFQTDEEDQFETVEAKPKRTKKKVVKKAAPPKTEEPEGLEDWE